MRIWVDSDACPRDAKDIVFRTAKRLQIEARLVAHQTMRVPRSPWITLEVVTAGFDAADDHIADNVQPGDLVVTADIPLAARIVDAGATGIDPRGLIYDADNVKEKLATRNLLAQLRDEGLAGTGPPPYRPADKNKFASALDALLNQSQEPKQE